MSLGAEKARLEAGRARCRRGTRVAARGVHKKAGATTRSSSSPSLTSRPVAVSVCADLSLRSPGKVYQGKATNSSAKPYGPVRIVLECGAARSERQPVSINRIWADARVWEKRPAAPILQISAPSRCADTLICLFPWRAKHGWSIEGRRKSRFWGQRQSSKGRRRVELGAETGEGLRHVMRPLSCLFALWASGIDGNESAEQGRSKMKILVNDEG